MYAHEMGFPWNSKTCTEAATWGRRECLQYAHENGCPMDESVCWESSYFGLSA